MESDREDQRDCKKSNRKATGRGRCAKSEERLEKIGSEQSEPGRRKSMMFRDNERLQQP
jgi:hypothetical protein